MRYFLTAGAVLGLTVSLVHVGISRTLEPQPAAPFAGLAEQVRAAKGHFDAAKFAAAKAAAQNYLKASVEYVGSLLPGDSDAAKGWKAALLWTAPQNQPSLNAAINPSQTVTPAELEQLDDAVREAQRSAALDREPGDETNTPDKLHLRAALNTLHDALYRYDLILTAEKEGAAAHVDKLLGELADSLAADPATWFSGNSKNPGALLGELNVEFQATPLVDEIRAQFDQPNLEIIAPEPFVAKLVELKDVDRPNEPLTDRILGTDIVGTTSTTGKKTFALVPNSERATFRVTFDGAARSSTVGYHSPVTVTSHSYTKLDGTILIDMDGDAASPGQTCGRACTSTCIDCIAICGGRLVQRIATRKVYQSKPEAECIAGQHAEQRLDAALLRDTREALGTQENAASKTFNGRYQARIRDPLRSWGALPHPLAFATTADALTIHAREAGDFQLGAPVSAPMPQVASDPKLFLGLRVHQSFINNLLAASLAGRTFSQEQFDDGVRNLLGDEAADMTRNCDETGDQAKKGAAPETEAQREDRKAKLKAEREFRKITFADHDPVTVQFSDHEFSITIRGKRFEGEDLKEPALDENITAHYKIVEGKNGVADHADRIGDIEVEMPASRTQSPSWRHLTQLERAAKKAGERDKIRHRFGCLLPPKMIFKGLDFCSSAPPWNNIGKMDAYRISTGGGWLSVDWSQNPTPCPYAAPGQ